MTPNTLSLIALLLFAATDIGLLLLFLRLHRDTRKILRRLTDVKIRLADDEADDQRAKARTRYQAQKKRDAKEREVI